MGFSPKTKSGYSLYTMSSMLQKAIRRCDVNNAAFAAKELRGSYNNYLWKRLLVISAEDCYGVVTKEIVGLKIAHDIVNKGRKGYDTDSIFVAKAVLLLCMARKNRDACYVACNFLREDRLMNPEDFPEEYMIDIDEAELDVDGIPDWVFDVHTLKGKANGKTDLDMIRDEEKALKPKQNSLFDNASWEIDFTIQKAKGTIHSEEEWNRIIKFMAGKESDPTHNGKKWADEINQK